MYTTYDFFYRTSAKIPPTSYNSFKTNIAVPRRRPGYDSDRGLVQLTEPSIEAHHSINITHSGTPKNSDKERLEKEELQYHDEDADYIYEEPIKIKPIKDINNNNKNERPLEDESKFYSSPKNNVEILKDQSDDAELDDIETSHEHDAPKAGVEAHTVILTDNFFLPGSKSAEENPDVKREPEEEYIYEYEYEDETEPETIVTTAPTATTNKKEVEIRTTVSTSTTTHNVKKDVDSSVATIKSLSNDTAETDKSNESPSKKPDDDENTNTTESWVVVASVQTSRSVSGARFLPLGVKQEEKKAPLTELEALAKLNEENSSNPKDNQDPNFDTETVTTDYAVPETTVIEIEPSTEKSIATSFSTESINDKLDSIQSELSSRVLSGKFPVLKETTTQEPATTKLPPVFIRKFSPKSKTTSESTTITTTTTTISSTQSPKGETTKKIVLEDDLTGLLPADFKPRYQGYKKKTTTTETPSVNRANNTRSFKNNPSEQSLSFVEDDLTKFLPKDFSTTKNPESKLVVVDDIGKFLPPGYNKKVLEKGDSKTDKPLPVIPINDDLLKFLPKGYAMPPTEITAKPIPTAVDDISKLLPPGFKTRPDIKQKKKEDDKSVIPLSENKPKEVEDLFAKLLQKSQSPLDALLPPDFKPVEVETTTSSAPTTESFKVVFPSRPGSNKANNGPKRSKGPPPVKIDIKKGPPTR